MHRADVIVIGGGIVGLATAWHATARFPGRRVLVLEKEKELAFHQTGRNSGVLHSGIYYRPGSMKAINCREGKRALEAFCDAEGIAYELCGKVIVAVDETELPALQRIYERGEANGVRCELIDADRLRELEPHAAGVRAIHVPEAGIIDFRQVCHRLAEQVAARGGEVRTSAKVTSIARRDGGVVLGTPVGEFAAPQLVICGGLHSDRLTRLGGERPEARIVPFRGEYYELEPAARRLCRNLIYPVPDPQFPFLGVHFTRRIDGSVECGPNAVLAFAREGYRMRDVNLRDLAESLTYGGFVRMALRYWKAGAGEMWRSLSKRAFVRALRRLVPEIALADLHPAPAGVRAQAVTPDGRLVDDFLIQESPHVIHVGNAPSPAATASLNIGRLVVDKLAERIE